MVLDWARSIPWVLPWQKRMTYDPIHRFVTEPDPDICRELAKEWREAKLAELNYVGVTSALVTGALSSAIGWQTTNLLPYVLGVWFAGLVLVLTAIYIASSQSIALHRLTNRDAGIDRLCVSLGRDPNAQQGNIGRSRLRKPQVLVWQMPVMLLNLSITIFLLGFICQVLNSYTKTRKSVEQLILTVLALAFAITCWLMSFFMMYL